MTASGHLNIFLLSCFCCNCGGEPVSDGCPELLIYCMTLVRAASHPTDEDTLSFILDTVIQDA